MLKQNGNHNQKVFEMGYGVSLFGAVLILLWIGIFKFTPSEAKAIEDLVQNHFLTFWVYDYFSLQAISNAIGLVEVGTALGLILSIWIVPLRKYVAWTMILTFLITLSYLFTTPKMWRMVDGIPITDFFILKDILLLGFSLMLLGNASTDNTNTK
ncbi:MAG: DUF417 family protein [Bacteroidota bacterium]|nr:DUF417 family protein [Bacteroidota bacterium]